MSKAKQKQQAIAAREAMKKRFVALALALMLIAGVLVGVLNLGGEAGPAAPAEELRPNPEKRAVIDHRAGVVAHQRICAAPMRKP